MKKGLLKISFLIILALIAISCKQDDDSTSISIRDRQEVYDENITEIEQYLQNHYLDLMDFSVKEVTSGETSIWDDMSTPGNPYPLQYITVKNDTRASLLTDDDNGDPVDYKLYYIVINEGVGENPVAVDSTYSAYKGWTLEDIVFDQNNTGVWFTFPESANASISGYRQILSLIKTEATDGSGTTINPDGSVSHNGFGRVIVFIPSGLAYFSINRPNIGQYRPLIFDIKLFYRRQRDHDNDRIESQYEDINGDKNYFNDDSDGDKLPDFVDTDDDGDGFLTKFEIRYEPDPILQPGVYDYYDFSSIPFCSGGLIKKHLDPNCN